VHGTNAIIDRFTFGKIRYRIVDYTEFYIYFIYSLTVHLPKIFGICNIENVTRQR